MSSEQFRLNCAVESNDFELTKELLTASKANPAHNEYFAVRRACKNKNIDIFQLLLKDARIHPGKAKLIIRQTRDQDMIDFYEANKCLQSETQKPKQ